MAEIRHWLAFASVARDSSISAASEKLSLSQPALSKQIGELERELGIRLVEGPIDEPNIDIRPFFEDELVVIAPLGHPLAKRRSSRLADVLAYGLILREHGSGTRAVFEQSVRDHDLKINEVATLGSSEA